MQTATENEEPVGNTTNRFLRDKIFESTWFCNSKATAEATANIIMRNTFDAMELRLLFLTLN